MVRGALRARAPGSLMMMGEHAVLHGQPALVAAVNAWMQVELIPRDDGNLRIESQLGTYQEPLAAKPSVADYPEHAFVLAAVARYVDALPSGITLLVDAEFRSTIGFGSSAAVTVAALAVLRKFLNQAVNPVEIAREAGDVIRGVQGRGSGADAAASALGGMVALDPVAGTFESIPFAPAISIIYAGYKTPTPEVIKQVDGMWEGCEEKRQALYQSMGDCSRAALAAAQVQDVEGFARCCNRYQKHLVSLGVSNADLDAIAHTLRANMPGAKISGAGLGDCVIGVGSSEGQVEGYETVTVPLSKQGLVI